MFSCLRKSSKKESKNSLAGTDATVTLSLDGFANNISNAIYQEKSSILLKMLATKYDVPESAITVTVLSSPSATNLKVRVTIQGTDATKFTTASLQETLYSWKQLLNATLCDGVSCYAGMTCDGGKCVTAPNTDPCANVNCGANGTCCNGKCICQNGYSGDTCQTAPANPCAGVDCGANGTCCNGKCFCKNGYTGDNCQTAPAPVQPPTPCAPNGLTWVCIPNQGNSAYLPIARPDEVECLSTNGTSCIWSSTLADCNAQISKIPSMTNLKPLKCGAMHYAQFGSSGYDTKDHWCATGMKKFPGTCS